MNPEGGQMAGGLGWAVAYGGLALIVSLAGGWLPRMLRLTHVRLQLAVSFVAGFMLALAFLHLMPHGNEILGGATQGGLWMLGGFLVMFLVQRFFPFHHHDVEEGQPAAESSGHGMLGSGCGHDHGHGHGHGHDHGHHHSPAPVELRGTSEQGGHMGWLVVTLGLSFHSVFDGIAIAAAVMAGSALDAGALPGLGAALAVVLHKPLDALSIMTLMAARSAPGRWQTFVNFGFALITPVSAVLFCLLATDSSVSESTFVGAALAFSAGTFTCIAASDLLPELQFHHHDRFKLSVALVAGVLLAWGIGQLEPGHGHNHDSDQGHDHDHDHACARVPARVVVG